MGVRTRSIAAQIAGSFADANNAQALTPTSNVTFSTVIANKVTANGAAGSLGQALISGGSSSNVYWGIPSFAFGISANTTDTNTNYLTFSTINAGSTNFLEAAPALGYVPSTTTLKISTINATSNGITLAPASLAMGNTSVNVAITPAGITSSGGTGVNPFSNTVGTALGTASARWVLNANTGNFSGGITTANVVVTTGVYPTSNSSGQALGSSTQQWVVLANSVTTSAGVYPTSNTVGTALGSTTQRWVINANTINSSGNITMSGSGGSGIFPSSNTTATSVGGVQSLVYVTANTVTIGGTGTQDTGLGGVFPISNTQGTNLGGATQRWALYANTINASANVTTTGTVFANNTVGVKNSASISAGSLTLDIAIATAFEVSFNATITSITINNVQSSGYLSSFVLTLVGDGTSGRAVTWPTSFLWPAGTAPTLTTTLNKRDVFVFFTYDGGTTWIASIVGQNI